jgi:hypothetical protein
MDLQQSVVLFRKAMLKAKADGFQFDLLDFFPVNCCECSSYLLAKFLIEKIGLSSLKIVTGENRHKKSQRHIWIKLDETDIDITANQFSSTDRTVIIEAHSQWHQRFEIINVENPNPKLTQLNKDARPALLHDYEKILSCLAYDSVRTIQK